MTGGQGDDKMHGGQGDDKVWGGQGDDRMTGGQGNDQLGGGTGDDIIHAGQGNDTAWGGQGDDRITGGQGEDKLHGGQGDDVLKGGSGDDILIGDGGLNAKDDSPRENLLNNGSFNSAADNQAILDNNGKWSQPLAPEGWEVTKGKGAEVIDGDLSAHGLTKTPTNSMEIMSNWMVTIPPVSPSQSTPLLGRAMTSPLISGPGMHTAVTTIWKFGGRVPRLIP